MNTPFVKWFLGTTSRKLILPVPQPVVQARLQNVLASPQKISNGFLVAKTKYSGTITGNDVVINITTYGKSVYTYTMRGQLVNDAKGTGLLMTVTADLPIIFFASFGVAIPVCFVDLGISGKVLLALFFLTIICLANGWHRDVAANGVSNFVYSSVTEKMK